MIIVVLVIIQIASLFRYVDKSNQLLSRAFESVLSDDFSERLDTHLLDNSFKEVYESLNQITTKFQKNRLEKEQHFQYLQAVIEQTGMGLISVTEDGEVNLINRSARHILELQRLRHMQQLESSNKRFHDMLVQMKSGEKHYFDIDAQSNSTQVAVYAKDIQVHKGQYRLYTVQNIQSELDEKEMDAWKNLTRVLSHEIMNSVTPISSLAATANHLIGTGRVIEISEMEDLRQALQTIEKRSQGLMQFINNYRRFARIPEPVRKIVSVVTLFNRIENLIKPSLSQGAISFSALVTPESLQFKVDPDLIEQVLLNLMSNAIDAVKESNKPQIRLTAEMDNKSVVVIKVSDNGRGICQDLLPRIFIPFYTTRPEGSGIGLSLSRQIMRLHGGNIKVKSEPGALTEFFCRFAPH